MILHLFPMSLSLFDHIFMRCQGGRQRLSFPPARRRRPLSWAGEDGLQTTNVCEAAPSWTCLGCFGWLFVGMIWGDLDDFLLEIGGNKMLGNCKTSE